MKQNAAPYAIDWILRRVPPGGTVLDLGCGTGALLRALSPQINRGIGVDASEVMLDKARADSGFDNLSFLRTTDHILPVDDKSVDVLVSVLSFHNTDWNGATQEILRVLRPGGRLLLIDMAAQDPAPPARTLVRVFAAAHNRIRAWFNEVFRQKYRQVLELPKGSARKPYSDYSRFLGAQFPGTKIETLGQTLRSRLLAFDSGPAGLARLHRWAILDWGIGGCGMYALIKEKFPEAGLTYVSDAGFTPYGRASPSMLIVRLNAIIAFLHARGTRRLIVACNSMSTALTDRRITLPEGFEVAGIIEPAVDHLSKAAYRNLALIGGQRIVESGAYRRPLERAGKNITQAIARPLSTMIEAGGKDGAEFRAAAATALSTLKGSPQALVLACTHYPAAASVFQDLMPGVALIDPASLCLDSVLKRWGIPPEGSLPDVFCTSGDPVQTEASARSAFGVRMTQVLSVSREFS